MIAEKEKAAASTAATKNNLLKASYRNFASSSSLKIQIGELLFLLFTGNEQPDGWRQFEQLLCQCYEGGVL